MSTKLREPIDLNLRDQDLTVTTTYKSNLIDVRNAFSWTAILEVTETGAAATVGTGKITAYLCDEAGTELLEVDLVTGIDLDNGQTDAVIWGHGVSAEVFSTATAGTLTSNPNILSNARFLKVGFEATVASDAGTSATGSMHLVVEEV